MKALKKEFEQELKSSEYVYKLAELNKIHTNAINEMDYVYKNAHRRRNGPANSSSNLYAQTQAEAQRIQDAATRAINERKATYFTVKFDALWQQFIGHIAANTDLRPLIQRFHESIVTV